MSNDNQFWKTVSRSQFPHEQEALDFIYQAFPVHENYRAWANFEFVADDGSINEVDLLVACPQGVFVIEIKSWPGNLRGDASRWTVSNNGRIHTNDSPLILTNTKCKRLKSLLGRQKAFRQDKVRQPFFEPLIFLSHESVVSNLSGNAKFKVCLRDREGDKPRAGIMAAILRRECSGLKENVGRVNRPSIKAMALALEQAGIRPSQASRRVGDFILQEMVFDSPLRIYQDWTANHVTLPDTQRLARTYLCATQSTDRDREVITQAAVREFKLLERLDHPGILKADPPSESDFGPVLFFRRSPRAVSLDQFLCDEGKKLRVDHRLDLLRQIGEVIAYAHGQRIVHRSVSPKSVLVERDAKGSPKVQVSNWLTGGTINDPGSSTALTKPSDSLHAGELLEDSSHVYLAPEVLDGSADGGEEMDVFSLGALAYLVFTEQPPASSITDLQQKLKNSISGGLDVREVIDGAPEALVGLVRESATATASDRMSVDDFLTGLDLIEEELTAPEDKAVTNPHEAKSRDELPHGLRLLRRLGSGATSVAYLVEDGADQVVLKLAQNADSNERLVKEFGILQTIQEKSPAKHIVRPYRLLEFGELRGFTMEQAGNKSVARLLREDGPLDLTLLQRYGEDLLSTIRELDDIGIPHRDIKPDNMGVFNPGKKGNRLCLFDFSLSSASPDDVRAGTLAYMDPFIGERKTKRWDVSSECFSAAMTLHEMATGTLPIWGDGKSDRASIEGEVTIQGERFDPDLRDRFVNFFEKALCRDFRDRFDNPSQILEEWSNIFATIDQSKVTVHAGTEDMTDDGEHPFSLPDLVQPGTQLILLNLSTRLINALERLGLSTVRELLAFPLLKIYRLPGVGNKTRRELGALVKELRLILPEVEQDPVEALSAVEPDMTDITQATSSVDLIAKEVTTLGKGKAKAAERELLWAFLGWGDEDADGACWWPSQTDLAETLDVTRQRIGQVATSARERWRRFPSVTGLRDTISGILKAAGGVMAHVELVQAVLAARGSEFDEPKRTQMASVATRAALETERALEHPRFKEYRSGEHIFVSQSSDLRHYAVRLGKVADELALEDPLPTPAAVTLALEAVPLPEFPEDTPAPAMGRVAQLAVVASEGAALSSRMEIYPQGLAPARALSLVQNALFGGVLTVDEIRRRVKGRLPHAAPIPGRPELTELIDGLGIGLVWDPAEGDGAGAFVMPAADLQSLHSSQGGSTRRATRASRSSVVAEVSEEFAEAMAIDDKLKYADENGGFRILSVPPEHQKRAAEELQRRYPAIEACDLDAVFLDHMQAAVKAAGGKWEAFLRADAAEPGSRGWTHLMSLVERILPDVDQTIRSADKTRLLTHPGLFARYDRMSVLGELATEVSHDDTIHGVWLLVPANDQNPRPTLNGQAIPFINDAQHLRLNEAWLYNRHRSN